MTKDYLKLDDKDEYERTFIEVNFNGILTRAEEKGLVVDCTKGVSMKNIVLFAINGEPVKQEDIDYVMTSPKKKKSKSIFGDPMMNGLIEANNHQVLQMDPPNIDLNLRWFPVDHIEP